jgi:hypothetical protein
MWLFTKQGFFSVVHKDCAHDEVVVRARVRADLDGLLRVAKVKGRILSHTGTDYPFRVIMKRSDFSVYLIEYCIDLNYSNFKDTISAADDDRHSVYCSVWYSLLRLYSVAKGKSGRKPIIHV